MLSVTSAKYLGDYKVTLSFDNGKIGTVNLREVIFNDKRSIFLELQKEDEFKKFKIDRNTLIWSNGLDLAPEFLFFVTFKKEIEFQDKFKEWGYVA
jgi:Protein of unknown function (DUF2442)